MQTPPFSLGIVGCGYIFRAMYAPVLKAFADRIRLVAVGDPNETVRAAALESFPEARGYSDLDSLLREESPDAVMVLTTERWNAPISMQALRAGVPVYLEKPPAASLPQLEELISTESATGIPVYAAFNRRHTPLFREWRPPEDLRKVRGVLSRIGRSAHNFAYTAVHVIDAAQYFSGSLLAEAEVRFAENNGAPQWEVRGRLENGAACEWLIAPNGGIHDETLVFETPGGEWTLNFPNPGATHHAAGRMAFQAPGAPETVLRTGQPESAPQAVGFMDTFNDFLTHLEGGRLAESPHRLTRCRPTIRLMENLLDAAGFGRP